MNAENLAYELLGHLSLLNIKRVNLHKYLLAKDPFDSNEAKKQYDLAWAELSNKRFKLIDKFGPLEAQLPIAKNAIKKQHATCVELGLITLLIFYFEMKVSLSEVVNCVGQNGFNHVFSILGLKATSSIPRYRVYSLRELPPDCVILDPWLNCYFTPDKARYYFKDVSKYYDYNPPNGDPLNLQFTIKSPAQDLGVKYFIAAAKKDPEIQSLVLRLVKKSIHYKDAVKPTPCPEHELA